MVNYFALNANPGVYRVEDAVANLGTDLWNAKKARFEAGDRVIIWKSYGTRGPRRDRHRGVVALGEVLDSPSERPSLSRYWIAPATGALIQPRVEVRYIRPPNLPLWEHQYPALGGLTVCGGQGTVFIVQPDQFEMVVRLAGGWPQLDDEVGDAESAITVLNGDTVQDGQGFSICSDCRREVESRAMGLAGSHYHSQGYTVEDVSSFQSYDLKCLRDDVELHVEVKGTRGDGNRVLLTRKEVEHAQNYRPAALLIVKEISSVHSDNGACQASGGSVELHDPWDINEGDLVPIGYSYVP
jgi:hypothetical protein